MSSQFAVFLACCITVTVLFKVVVKIVKISNKVQKSMIAELAIQFAVSSLCGVHRDPVVYIK